MGSAFYKCCTGEEYDPSLWLNKGKSSAFVATGDSNAASLAFADAVGMKFSSDSSRAEPTDELSNYYDEGDDDNIFLEDIFEAMQRKDERTGRRGLSETILGVTQNVLEGSKREVPEYSDDDDSVLGKLREDERGRRRISMSMLRSYSFERESCQSI